MKNNKGIRQRQSLLGKFKKLKVYLFKPKVLKFVIFIVNLIFRIIKLFTRE